MRSALKFSGYYVVDPAAVADAIRRRAAARALTARLASDVLSSAPLGETSFPEPVSTLVKSRAR